MMFIRKADLMEGHGEQQCRIKAFRAPVVGARYEVWLTSGGKGFHEKGGYPAVEGLMLKADAPREFYELLVEASMKMGTNECFDFRLSLNERRCLASISLWRQDLRTVNAITGLGESQAREAMFLLHRKGHVRLVQVGGEVRFALTPKGEMADMYYKDADPSYKAIRGRLLNRVQAIDWAEFSGKGKDSV
jgi:hypothetical protein